MAVFLTLKNETGLSLTTGGEAALLFLFLFEFAFFLEAMLGFLLLFLVAFVFTTSACHNILLSVNGGKVEYTAYSLYYSL